MNIRANVSRAVGTYSVGLDANENHFNLLRLLAAVQVGFFHFNDFLKPLYGNAVYDSLKKFLWFFPGVNIFYFISGFLIWHSCEKLNGNIQSFYRNRFFRIYPGLWVAFACSLFALMILGQLNDVWSNKIPFAGWVFSQLTFFHYYTPGMFRDYGCGTPNGVLWTVVVEVQFYLLVPFLWREINRVKTRGSKNLILFLLATVSFCFNHLEESWNLPYIVFKGLYFSVFNFFYLFCLGILCYINLAGIYQFLKKYGIWIMLIYLLYAAYFTWQGIQLNRYHAETFSLITNTLLAASVFSFAFSPQKISPTLIRSNDFSYGFYLYHMPIINVLLTFSISWFTPIIFWIAALTFAILSWYVVERPFIKKKSLHVG